MPRTLAARVLLFAALAVGLALRAHVVFTDDGINWPDEIYQSFEPAHRLVFGHGLMPWEFLDGARTWAVPGFVACWLWLCRLVGADSPTVYVPLVKLVFSLLGLASAWGAYRLARTFGARELEASFAGALWALCAVALYFSHRAMSENLAAALLPWGLALAWDEASSRRARLLGASLLGLATLARLQAGLVCAVALLVLALRAWRARGVVGRWLATQEVALALGAWALVFGLWDAAAWHDAPGAKWGGLFHSAVVYVRFNVIEGKSAGWGTAAWPYYFVHLFRTMPGVAVTLAVAAIVALRRAWPVVLVVALFFAVHLAVGHKELRFLVPVLPLACALVGVALSALPERAARLALVVAALAAVPSTVNHRALTMGQVGSYLERPDSSAWDDFGPVNRLLLAASRRTDVCGLRVDAAHLAWTGGSTYLHVRAPLYMPGTPHQRGFFNYVITRPGSGGELVAREGPWELVRLVGLQCVPDPGYTWRLP